MVDGEQPHPTTCGVAPGIIEVTIVTREYYMCNEHFQIGFESCYTLNLDKCYTMGFRNTTHMSISHVQCSTSNCLLHQIWRKLQLTPLFGGLVPQNPKTNLLLQPTTYVYVIVAPSPNKIITLNKTF
jgi:hypothetical protein